MQKITLTTIVLTSFLWSNGAALYTKCAECHGTYAQKSALGKSRIIQGQKASKTYKHLKLYAKGEQNLYGYGSLMKMQVASFSDEELKSIARYIATLK
jgi:cytochrome c